MARRSSDHHAFGPEILDLIDNKINELIIKHHATPNMIVCVVGELTTIVALEDTWSCSVKIVSSANAALYACLEVRGIEVNFFTP
jgi:hypothetical protein